jgi:hypothetical protein
LDWQFPHRKSVILTAGKNVIWSTYIHSTSPLTLCVHPPDALAFPTRINAPQYLSRALRPRTNSRARSSLSLSSVPPNYLLALRRICLKFHETNATKSVLRLGVAEILNSSRWHAHSKEFAQRTAHRQNRWLNAFSSSFEWCTTRKIGLQKW